MIFIGSYSNEISRYSLSKEGNLSHCGQSVVSKDPSWISITLNKKYLFAVHETDNYCNEFSGSVASYLIESDGNLILLNQVSSGGAHPCHIALGVNNKLYISNYTSGTLSVIHINEDGTLNEPHQIISFNETDVEKEKKISHIHEVTIFDNNILFVNDLGKNSIYRFEIDTNGLLFEKPSHTISLLISDSGPRHFLIHPFAPFAFVINELSNSITSFSFNRQDGLLIEEITTISTLRSNEDNIEMGAAEIQISQNGKFIYGSNRDLSNPTLNRNSIVVFEINLSSGIITPLQHIDTGGIHPRHFNLFFNDSILVVGNMKTNTLVSFQVNNLTGLIGDPISQIDTLSPTHIVSYLS